MDTSAPTRHVMLLGFRGFPDVQGGVERHAEQLARQFPQLGWRVTALMRSPYVADERSALPHVRVKRLWAPRKRSLEAMVHTFLGVLYAAVTRPDVLHIHAVGPGLMVPLARLFGLKVVFTHHGPDYDRQKWGRMARAILRFGEWSAVRGANATIAISDPIRDALLAAHGARASVIPNGVVVAPLPQSQGILQTFGLTPSRYVVLVSRLVPEKRHLDLMQAFLEARLEGWKLVFVGSADHEDAYSIDLHRRAAAHPDVIMAGFQAGVSLAELYTHAGVFVLPSSHEGLPIAILEALAYGQRIIASNIPANLAVGMPDDRYFPLGDVAALRDALRRDSAAPPPDRDALRAWVEERFSWSRIAAQTIAVYRNCAG